MNTNTDTSIIYYYRPITHDVFLHWYHVCIHMDALCFVYTHYLYFIFISMDCLLCVLTENIYAQIFCHALALLMS